MSSRRYGPNDSDSSSRRRGYPDVTSAPVPRTSRDNIGSSSTATPKSSVSARGTYPTSHVRTESAPTQTISEFQLSRGVRKRMDSQGDSAKHPKGSATFTNGDQGSMYSREEEGTKIKNEPQFRSPNEDKQHRCNGPTDYKACIPHKRSSKESFDIHRPPPVQAKNLDPVNPSSATIRFLCDTQAREFSALQREHRMALEEKKKYADAFAALKHHYDERLKKLIAARHECQVAVVQRNELNDAYAALRLKHEEQTKRFNDVQHEHQAVTEEKKKAEEDSAALKQQYEAQKNEYSSLNNKYQSLKATLEQCTSELQGVQRFLATTDAFSGSEVVNALRRLNEDVQQSTTFMAEWAAENFALEPLPVDQMTAPPIEQTRASETLGMRFMQLVGTKKHKENPILLEMAFRAYLIYELYWIASPWSIGSEEQAHNVYIDGIFQRMREIEGQVISGNWRALTRAYTLPACIGDPELVHTIEKTITSGFSDILLAAGFTTPQSDVTSALWSKFGEKIQHFVSLAGQVNKVIGVGMIPEDFEVLVIWPDTAFNERTMEDSYDNGDRLHGAERQDTVLFATDLGLMQRMRVGAGSAQKGESSELILMKPKVALASVIDLIDE